MQCLVLLTFSLLILCPSARAENTIIPSSREKPPAVASGSTMTLEETLRKLEEAERAIKECGTDFECIKRIARDLEGLNTAQQTEEHNPTNRERPKPLSLDSVPPAYPLYGNHPNADEVRRILTAWLGRIDPELPVDICRQIERQMAGYPRNGRPSDDPISFSMTESEQTRDFEVKIHRQDWGYVWQGLAYTLNGIKAGGDDAMIGLGLWCFIRAALLHLEPNHLGNIGVCLILKGALNDASTVLCYAAAQDSLDPGVHNNLAYVLAKQGRNEEAFAAALRAAALNPDSQRYRKSVAQYAKAAGLNPEDLSFDPARPGPAGGTQSLKKPKNSQLNVAAYSEAVSKVGSQIQAFNKLFEENSRYYGANFYSQYPGLAAEYERKLEQLGRDAARCEDTYRNSGTWKITCLCTLPYLKQQYRASMAIYDALVSVLEEWQLKDLNDLKNMYLLSLAALHGIRGLSPHEYCEMVRLARFDYERVLDTIESHALLLDPYLATPPYILGYLRQTLLECRDKIRDSEMIDPGEFYGRRPLLIKRLEHDAGRKWNLWLPVGSISADWNTIDVDLALTPLASGKLKHDARTNDIEVGLGIGLNHKRFPGFAQKLFKDYLKFELIASYHTAKGVQVYVEHGLSPQYGAMPGKPTARLQIFGQE